MERVMSTLMEQFVHQSLFEVDLVLYGRRRTRFFEVPTSVRVHEPRFDFDSYSRWLSTALTARFLRETLKRLQPDRVLSFGELWNSFVLLSALGRTQEIVVSDRCQPVKRFRWHQEVLRRWLYPHANKVIVQTEMARAHYRARFPSARFCVIGNPVAEVTDSQPSERDKTILNVARLISTKHHDRLIRMFASLASDDWDLVILGDDAQSQTHRARLEALAGSLGVAERVSIMGTVEDVEDYYRRASIFAFPSSSEGFPNALAEAMAHGMSCVSYDCCAGPGDLITEGETGYLVPVFDDAAFADRLERLMADGGLREEMGRKAKESMKAFAAHRIAQQYAEAILD
ncbi:glycosyltransferase [Spiribacter sp. 221]|uniref:glycosyltransferase n=1 Tax=Spiribacter onubensis TaxID=3122420 RepID=UPI00349F97CD